MDSLQQRYAKVILESMVRVQEGDSIAINTEQATLPFAKILAAQASEMTMQPAQIVVMEQGKPQGVIPVDPIDHDVLRPNPTGAAMIRIANTEDRQGNAEEQLGAVIGDFAALQSYEILSEPLIFDRRIAVPWAVVPDPGPRWTQALLGQDTHADKLWDMLQDIWKLDADDSFQAWENQVQMLHYRKKYLNSMKVKSLHFLGEGTDLTVAVPTQGIWEGGLHTLPNGRTFLPYLPIEALSLPVDRNNANGTFSSSRPIPLLGGIVQEATFTVANGIVVEYDAQQGKELLDAFFSIDLGARHIGECALADENTAIARTLDFYGLLALDSQRTTRIRFGSSNLSSWNISADIEDEQALFEQTSFNVSNVMLDCPIGNETLTVTAITDEDEEITLMEHGVFLD